MVFRSRWKLSSSYPALKASRSTHKILFTRSRQGIGASPDPPDDLHGVGFIFSRDPFNDLGKLKEILTADELASIYFSLGLASIVCLNVTAERLREYASEIGAGSEFWPIENGALNSNQVERDPGPVPQIAEKPDFALPQDRSIELSAYVEQISSSISTLWFVYGKYMPSERKTLKVLADITDQLVAAYKKFESGDSFDNLMGQKQVNAIVAAIVEISAALAYAVSQGTMGISPILESRSPFPHHSLLGVGSAIRALTWFTRFVENAFSKRDPAEVIRKRYSHEKSVFDVKIQAFSDAVEFTSDGDEFFDRGGDFHVQDSVPLITHFSLRHGYKESKFAVTAASEALTLEVLPQWTIMTLSHEIMHSKVRAIFQALFSVEWEDHENVMISDETYREFKKWYEDPGHEISISTGLRNVILYFCCALAKIESPIPKSRKNDPSQLKHAGELETHFLNNKDLAVELFVHFHDFYYAYAKDADIYLKSLWASWIKVAGPFARPQEYLLRSLATVASGTGLEPTQAFNYSKQKLLDNLTELEEEKGIRSPMFDKLRDLLDDNTTFLKFRPCYYLICYIARFFASKTIASEIDKLELDPFANGSDVPSDYRVNSFVHGGDTTELVSAIRYSLKSLHQNLSGEADVDDVQWLTARNLMVLSSQELPDVASRCSKSPIHS